MLMMMMSVVVVHMARYECFRYPLPTKQWLQLLSVVVVCSCCTPVIPATALILDHAHTAKDRQTPLSVGPYKLQRHFPAQHSRSEPLRPFSSHTSPGDQYPYKIILTENPIRMAMKVCFSIVIAVAMFGAALARPGYDHDYDVSAFESVFISGIKK